MPDVTDEELEQVRKLVELASKPPNDEETESDRNARLNQQRAAGYQACRQIRRLCLMVVRPDDIITISAPPRRPRTRGKDRPPRERDLRDALTDAAGDTIGGAVSSFLRSRLR